MVQKPKLAFIGSGRIGTAAAFHAASKELADVILFDVIKGVPEGLSLDISHASAIGNWDINIKGSAEYSCIAGADVAIITAGVPRKPGMSRDNLFNINSSIIQTVGEAIKTYCPNAFVICITNPLDIMVQILHKAAGLPTNMICGMAGVLDSGRLSYFLAEKMGVSVKDVQAMVLGSHGDSMVPLIRYSSVGGIPLTTCIEMGMITQEDVEAIVQRTRMAGGEIVGLLQNGSAYHSPAISALSMAEAYLKNEKRILPCCAYVDGKYGLKSTFVGVPCIIGGNGIEKIIEVPLTVDEEAAFKKSVNGVIEFINHHHINASKM